MILTIVGVVALGLLITSIVLLIKKPFMSDVACAFTFSSLLLTGVLVSICTGLVLGGCLYTIDTSKYIGLVSVTKHWDELTEREKVTMYNEIDKWNNSLNNLNNIWCRFNVEDRSEYIISLDWE